MNVLKEERTHAYSPRGRATGSKTRHRSCGMQVNGRVPSTAANSPANSPQQLSGRGTYGPPPKRSSAAFDRGGQTKPPRSNAFFSAPLTTRAPPTTVRPEVRPSSAAPVSSAAPTKKAFDRGGLVWPPRSNAADDRSGGVLGQSPQPKKLRKKSKKFVNNLFHL